MSSDDPKFPPFAFTLGLFVAFSAMLAPLTLAVAQLHLGSLATRIKWMGFASFPVACFIAWLGYRNNVIGFRYFAGIAVVLLGVWAAVLITLR